MNLTLCSSLMSLSDDNEEKKRERERETSEQQTVNHI